MPSLVSRSPRTTTWGSRRRLRGVAITVDDVVVFCNRTLDGYERALSRLDDTTVNAALDVPAANTPYQLVTHALAAARWWVDHIVCGYPSDRDRDGEFVASGSRSDLLDGIGVLRTLLAERTAELDAATELAFEAQTQTPLGRPWTVGAALIHAYEELAQHLGHLEVTVDLLV